MTHSTEPRPAALRGLLPLLLGLAALPPAAAAAAAPAADSVLAVVSAGPGPRRRGSPAHRHPVAVRPRLGAAAAAAASRLPYPGRRAPVSRSARRQGGPGPHGGRRADGPGRSWTGRATTPCATSSWSGPPWTRPWPPPGAALGPAADSLDRQALGVAARERAAARPRHRLGRLADRPAGPRLRRAAAPHRRLVGRGAAAHDGRHAGGGPGRHRPRRWRARARASTAWRTCWARGRG